ncbi:hypothetical protein T4B_11946 [Trichinella pseudospiralis]|uniref:Uncharacterized protein n=1 Tax=Trichinella pseudospiralis TaxID=6337 RepID=A0A0V1I533_TRIPS|nr:hypothetical protein T4B_11946 [Trichinella pseudospiralis]
MMKKNNSNTLEKIYLMIRKPIFPLIQYTFMVQEEDLKVEERKKLFKLPGTTQRLFFKACVLNKLCTKLKERHADVGKNRPAGSLQLTMSCTAAS